MIKKAANQEIMMLYLTARTKKLFLFGPLLLLVFCAQANTTEPDIPFITYKNSHLADKKMVIKEIVITGNVNLTQDAIRAKIPYKVDDLFDPLLSKQTINNLESLGYFSQITLEAEEISSEDNTLILYITLEERPLLEEIKFTGNSSLDAQKIKDELKLDKVPTIDQHLADFFAKKITDLYHADGHYHVLVTAKIINNPININKATVEFIVAEGSKSSVHKIEFYGNNTVPSRKLFHITRSKERWLLSFMNDTDGKYIKELLDEDRHRIEMYYRNYGYLTAKAYNTEVIFSENKKDITIRHFIDEGPQFKISSIEAPSDDVFSIEQTTPLLLLAPGDIYSEEKIRKMMEQYKELWGSIGYISADIMPQTNPDLDSKSVAIKFEVNKDKQLFANRIFITGNTKTRDKVIRRQLAIEEGDLITTPRMELSKQLVEQLSYFKEDSIAWRIHRVTDNTADLELQIEETKTGNLQFQLTFGNDQKSSRQELRGAITVDKRNFLGEGRDIGLVVESGVYSFKKFEARFFDPYFIDSNVSLGSFVYRKVDLYDQWSQQYSNNKYPEQTLTGANIRCGFRIPSFDRQVQIVTDFGIENINNRDFALTSDQLSSQTTEIQQFNLYKQRLFRSGTLAWIGTDIIKDTRNHQIYPNHGYKLTLSSKVAPLSINNSFSFAKLELQGSAYTPIIGRDLLVLGVQGKIGFVHGLGNDGLVPYKELFHIGGQSTVRGFTWGGISPAWKSTSDPIGGRKGLFTNVELTFPLLAQYGLKAHLFYDTGAGWDPQLEPNDNRSYIKRDKFTLRHSVGFGFNIVQPMPAKLDWGFKLNRKPGESPAEFHMSMNYAW